MHFPSLYQVNTRVWLTEISRLLNRRATLDDVADSELDRWQSLGLDWIWLLSVWQTGRAGQAVSRAHPNWQAEYRATLDDLAEDDIAGSGFAIVDYRVHELLGGPAALARLRTRLGQRGMRLMLDFVPNHTGLDHVWVDQHPEYFVAGTESDLARAPQNYVSIEHAEGPRVFAHGRDPYFDGWPDTLQLDYSHTAMQLALQDQLLHIADQCDGVRCDMAMLVLPEVFERTWGRRAAPFWPQAIDRVRQRWPSFCFLAEVYWDMERILQQQGFDYTYDKRLYDHVVADDEPTIPRRVREHLRADLDCQARSARFLENHDEQRAATVFTRGKHEAAAVISYLSPGLRFFHQGQFEGNLKRISPHLIRKPAEAPDVTLTEFYERLLGILKHNEVRAGQWQLLPCEPGWSGNDTWANFVAFLWQGQDSHRLVVVNFAPHASQCHIRLPLPDIADHDWTLVDQLGTASHHWPGADIVQRGIYFDEPAWRSAVFALQPVPL